MYHNYCTSVSTEYLYKVLVLYNSIIKYDSSFCLFILCLERQAYEILTALNLVNVVLIDAKELEQKDSELAGVKGARSISEYAWTAKASLLLYIFRYYKSIETLVWVDSDTMLKADPSLIFEGFREHSILLTSERFTDQYEYLKEKYGAFQMGFLGIRKDRTGITCLIKFRRRLIEWCFDKFSEGRWADQKYTVDWPEKYKNVYVFNCLGINMTPFILYRCIEDWKLQLIEKEDGVHTKDDRIVLFHYYGFKLYSSDEYDLCCYKMDLHDESIKLIYEPYIKEVQRAIAILESIKGYSLKNTGTERKYISNYYSPKLKGDIRWSVLITIEQEVSFAEIDIIKRFVSEQKVHLWICCNDENSCLLLKGLEYKNITVLSYENIEDEDIKKLKSLGMSALYRKAKAVSLLLHVIKNNYDAKYCVYTDIENLSEVRLSPLFHKWDGSYILCQKPDTTDIKILSKDILNSRAVYVLRNKYSLIYLKLLKKKYIIEALVDFETNAADDLKQHEDWLGMFDGIGITALKGDENETQLLFHIQ